VAKQFSAGGVKFLEVFQWVAPCAKNVFFYVHPECQYHVNNNRGTHCKERYVNEPHPDAARGNAYFIANCRTNTKSIPLHKFFKSVHTANLKIFSKEISETITNYYYLVTAG